MVLLLKEGTFHDPSLAHLMDHPFLKAAPPKSTGREEFGNEFLQEFLKWAAPFKLSEADLIATLTAFTVSSIQEAYNRFLPVDQPIDVFFSGGGVHNPVLMERIQQSLPNISVCQFEKLGMPADAREAISFAVLANELLSDRTIAFPGVTGVTRPALLGKISLGAHR